MADTAEPPSGVTGSGQADGGTAVARLDSELSRAVDAIRDRCDLRPRLALLLGSGLGPLREAVSGATVVPYAEIPGFPVPRAPVHAGELVLGELGGLPVAVMSGRAHLYDGYGAAEIAFPVRTMSRLGVETLLVTNAAGGVRLDLAPGDLMLITDHINLTGHNPLTGPNADSLGTRFPDMTEAYDLELRALAREAALAVNVPLAEGVYLGLAGPSFETPAEIRMARTLGADAVGMSTVLEVIAARHCGLRVLGISCITNMAAGITTRKLSAAEVVETAELARPRFAALLHCIAATYGPAVDAGSGI